MTDNAWIHGYIENILESVPSIDDDKTSEVEHGYGGGKSTALRYFFQEVAESNEKELHRTWAKATAMKNSYEKSNRLENLSWRIWHLIRQKKQYQLEKAQRLEKIKKDRQESFDESKEDIPDYTSDTEPPETPTQSTNQISPSKFSESAPDVGEEGRRLYIVLISLHGLVRGESMELGRDSDTGGQVKYVVEFARALATMPHVYRVDLLTRQIIDENVDRSYAEPTEMLDPGFYESDIPGGESSGAYIIRIPCGPKNKYIRKELLWPYVTEFVDGALSHIVHMTKVLGDQINDCQPVWPYVIHGHYADAGDCAALISGALNVPMVLTGHSLGRNKLEQLLKQGRQSKEDINATYKITRRIQAEEFSLDAAELVVSSTRQEVDEQWGLYDGFDVRLEKVLRARQRRGVSCHGRYMPRMTVIPPGMEAKKHASLESMDSANFDSDLTADTSILPSSPRPNPPIWNEIMRFFTHPHKPMILALARPDPKKNIPTLVKAFGESKPLRELANLTLIMGNRDDIDRMSGGSADVLTTVLKLIDRYDLYGEVAYPKHHNQHDVPDIYALAAKTKGVFINPALVEPFGLTLIEAASHGLPMVATKNGGPVDIQSVLHNGLLIDPHNTKDITEALLQLVSEREKWMEFRKNGLQNIHKYSWPEHCRSYLERVSLCRLRHPQWRIDTIEEASSSSTDWQSLSDSLRGMDLSLRLSADGRESFTSWLDGEQLQNMKNGQLNGQRSGSGEGRSVYSSADEMSDLNGKKMDSVPVSMSAHGAIQRFPFPVYIRKRKALIMHAVDGYDGQGNPSSDWIQVLKAIRNLRNEKSQTNSTGLGIATPLSCFEVVKLLNASGISILDLDVVITGGGSEVFYPSLVDDSVVQSDPALKDRFGGVLVKDQDYNDHVKYRWSSKDLKISLQRYISQDGGEKEMMKEEQALSTSRRLMYRVMDADKVPSAEELKKRFRMRGFRCHVIHSRHGNYLQLLPIHASRAQALRYLFVRWNFDLSKLTLVMGATGDTDYEELMGGLHRTVILNGLGYNKPEALDQWRYGAYNGEFEGLSNVLIVEKEKTTPALLAETLKSLKIV